MKLRSFKAYANTAPYVPFARPVNLTNLDGYAAGAGWLQIHDKASAPSNGDVPLKSFNVAAAGPLMSLFQTLGAVVLQNGLAIAFSSTEATYTASATSFDAFGEVEDYQVSPAGTVVDDANVAETTVWTNSNTKRLARFTVTNNQATARHVMLFAHSPSDGDAPLEEWELPSNGEITEDFGVAGREVIRRNGLGTAADTSCYLKISTTAGVLTGVGADCTFSCEYFDV